MLQKPPVTWDFPTRIMHWALALCVVLNLFLLEEGDEPHQWIGYTAVAIVGLRFFWGFVGSPASRFSSFPVTPKSFLEFIQTGLDSSGNKFKGHNPLASATYIGMWICVSSLGISGYMMGLDAYWGEEWLEEIHEIISNVLQAFIVIHLIGIGIDSFRYKRKTWLGMITGKK